jgi:hypothetical protein
MTRESIRYRLAVLCTALLTLASSAAAGEVRMPPQMTLRVHDRAGVDGDIMREATRRVDEIYAAAGILIDWEAGEGFVAEGDPPTIFDVVIAPGRMRQLPPASAEAHVMGRAALAVRRAYVYYGRVRDAAVDFRRFPANLLGDVIAHEVGHLLLPPGSHSETGIMRPNLAGGEILQEFDAAQADVMRSALEPRLEIQQAY